MQNNQYKKLINNIFSDDSSLDIILDYFPVGEITNEVSLSVLGVLNQYEKDLLGKYIDYKKGNIDFLEEGESKKAKKIGMKLLNVISSFYDKIQDTKKFGKGNFFYEKEVLMDKIKRDFHNPGLALEYILLSYIGGTNKSFYLAPQELESKQVDFLSNFKSNKKVLAITSDKDYKYNPSFTTGWQLTVSSSMESLKHKLSKIGETIKNIENIENIDDKDNNDKIKILRKRDIPDVIALIVIDGYTENFIKPQTNLDKYIDNSFTEALNNFEEKKYFGKIESFFQSSFAYFDSELKIVSESIVQIQSVFDTYLCNTNLLKNQDVKEEFNNGIYTIDSSYNKREQLVTFKVYLKGKTKSLYEVRYFITSKIAKKLKLNLKAKPIKNIPKKESSIAKDIIDSKNKIVEDGREFSDKNFVEVSKIFNKRTNYEEQINHFIDYYKENNELQSGISLSDLIFLYKVLPELEEICKNRIIGIIEGKDTFIKKIESLSEVYKLAPEYGNLKEFSFKYVEEISVKGGCLTKEAEEYWFKLLDSKINQNKEFKIQVFILGLKILTNHIIEYNKLKEIFIIIKKQTNLLNIKNNLEDLVDTLLIKMLNSKLVRNSAAEEIIEEMIFLYQASCCSREGKKIVKKIEEIYSYDNIENFVKNNLKKLWNFSIESEIYINSINAFDDLSKDFNDYSILVTEIHKSLKGITVSEFIEETILLYNNSSNEVKKQIDLIIFNNKIHCSKNNLEQYFKTKNNYSLIILELNNKIKLIKGVEVKSSSYIFIDGKDKLDDLKDTLDCLLGEFLFLQKESISTLDQGLEYYGNNPDSKIIDMLLINFVRDYKGLIKVYNRLSNNELVLKEEIFHKMLKNVSLDLDLNEKTKPEVDKLLFLYNEGLIKGFIDINVIYKKIKGTINSYDSVVDLIKYILLVRGNKNGKSAINKLINLLLSDIEKNINLSINIEGNGINIINRLIEVNEIKKLINKKNEEEFKNKISKNIDSGETLLHIVTIFHSDIDFISDMIKEKLDLISDYDLGIKLYKKVDLEILLVKIIDLISNVEQTNELYKDCKSNNTKKLLLEKHLGFVNNIFNLNELKGIYKKVIKTFYDDKQKGENVLESIYRNKDKIIQNESIRTDNIALDILLFIYKNTKDVSLKTSLINDIIQNSNDFDNLCNIYISIKKDNDEYIDNSTRKSIIGRMEKYINSKNIVSILIKLFEINDEDLLYSLKENLIKHSYTVKVYDELKKYNKKIKKQDFLVVFLDRLKDKVIKNIKNIEKLKIELEESTKSTQKKNILDRMIDVGDSFEVFYYIYNVCNKNTFPKSYVSKKRKILFDKMQSVAKTFNDFEFLYIHSTTKINKSKFLLEMNNNISNIKDIISLYSIDKDENLLLKIENVLNISNYKEYLEASKKYPKIRMEILNLITTSDEFKKLSFDELKYIYNKIRKKEEFKNYSKKLFNILVNSIKNIEEFGDIITIYDNNNFLGEESLNLLKEKIKKHIGFFGKGFLIIDNKLDSIKSLELKEFILEIMNFYYKDINNILSVLEEGEGNENIVGLRPKLIKKGTLLLQSMELLMDDELHKIYLNFKHKLHLKVFNTLLINKLENIGAFNNNGLDEKLANDNLDEIKKYIIENSDIELNEKNSSKNLEELKKLLFMTINKNWNELKKYTNSSKDELFHVIFNKTL